MLANTVALITMAIPSQDNALIGSRSSTTAIKMPNTGSSVISSPVKLAGTLSMPLFHSQ